MHHAAMGLPRKEGAILFVRKRRILISMRQVCNLRISCNQLPGFPVTAEAQFYHDNLRGDTVVEFEEMDIPST